MECANIIFPIILYLLGIVLLIALIVLVIKGIYTLKKIDIVMDDVSEKSAKLNGVFNMIDNTTDMITSISEKAIDFISSAITGIFSHRRKKMEEEENEE